MSGTWTDSVKAHHKEGYASEMSRIQILESRSGQLNPLLFCCGGGGRNIGRELKKLDAVSVDTSHGADILLDQETLSIREMRPQLLRYADLPFIGRMRSLLKGHDAAFVVTGLGGFAGGSGAAVIAKAASALSVPVIVSAALPFAVEGGMRRAEARRDLDILRENASLTAAFENNIILESTPGMKMTQALSVMNRIVSSPLAELLRHVDTEWARSLTGKHYRCTYSVDYSAGEGWEKRAVHALLAQAHEAGGRTDKACLFVESADVPEESAAGIAGEMERVSGARMITVWAGKRDTEGQNRVAALMLSE